tara:strand:- start:4617 stop:8804 length:4188 start_codon:yes stop_codon:yes gene_type:complete
MAGIPIAQFTPEVPISVDEFQPEPIDAKEFKPERPSNPIKQGIAGVSDAFTGLPMVAGVVGAGLEAAAKYPFNDKGYIDNFNESLSSGIDKDLVDLGQKGRNATNNALGIQDPKSTEDQAARLLTSLVLPVPAGFLGGAAATGLKGALGKATTFALPTVRKGPSGFDKVFAVRAGTQVGVGGGLEQGVRALQDSPDHPLILSDEAINGPTNLADKNASIPVSEFEAEDAFIPEPPLAQAEKKIQEQENSDNIRNIALGTTAIVATLFGARFSKQLLAGRNPTVTGLDAAAQTNALGDAVNTIRNSDQPITQAGSIVNKGVNRFFGNTFDKTKHVETELKAANIPDEDIAQITGQEIVDPFGVTEQFLKDGKFGQGSPTVVRSLRDIKREWEGLSPELQQEFVDGMGYAQQDIARTRATALDAINKDVDGRIQGLRQAFDDGSIDDLNLVMSEQQALVDTIRGTSARVKPGLFKTDGQGNKTFVGDGVLNAGIDNLKRNPVLHQMQKDIAKINEAVLDEAVRRGTASAEWANAIKKQFTIDDGVLYLPGKESIKKAAWYQRLATNMGFHSSTGKTLRGVANWHKQGLTESNGIASPLDPFQATAHYAQQVMEHTTRSAQQWNILSKIAGVRIGDDGIWRIDAPQFSDNGKGVKLIGTSNLDDPLNTGGNLNVVFNSDKKIAEMFGTGEVTMTPQQIAKLDDAIWVQRGNTYYGFHVPDRQLKKSLEFDASLHNRVLEFGNFWKNTFTQFTTGNLSPFAPISFLYNQQIGAFNAALKSQGGIAGASREAFEVWKDSYKGAWEFFSTRASEDFADLLTRSIQTNSTLFRAAPDLVLKTKNVLANKVKNSMLGPLQRETGRSASSLGASEFQGNMTNILESAVPHISNTYGANVLPQFWRIWSHLNTSLHEGTALGIAMRKSHEAHLANPNASLGNISRQARRDANDLVGDVRLRGSSDAGKAFHAVVPFSGAMLQSWSTMGRAIRKGGVQKTIGTIAAGVGIPTALEVAYNNLIDDGKTYPDAEGVQWSYKDYYWKGFSQDQRNNNVIIFKPGSPPWEAILVPVTPEISMFRGAIIDSMGTLFGLEEAGLADGNHFLAGLSRVFDIPIPPPIAALGSSLGLDLRAGILPDDTEGKGFSFFEGRNLTGGERVTPNYGRTKYIGGEIDKEVVAVIQDIFGAGGTLMVNVYEAFNAGNESTSIDTRAEFAMDELARNVVRQARYLQPLFGKALRNSPDPHISRDVLGKKDALQRAAKGLPILTSGGLMSGKTPSRGNSLQASQDPVAQLLSMQANEFLKTIKPLDQAIAQTRGEIAELGASTRDRYKGKDLTIKQRDETIDALNLRITTYKSHQLAILKKLEEVFAQSVQENVGTDITGFEFNNYQPRKNPTGSALQVSQN